jgi:hypothetical protein
MKKTLIIMLAIAFTSMSTFAENINNGDVVKTSIKKSTAAEDWNTIKKALLESDAKTLGGFAGSDVVDSEALVKDASALSYVHQVLKSYDYKHLIKEELSGLNYLVFEAHTTTTDDKDNITAHVFKLYMTETDGKLMISFYVNVKA